MKSWLSSLVTSAITKCKRYNIESTQVTVTWQEFLPPGKEPPPGKAVLFFPGWPLRVDSKSIRELAEELANYSGTKTFVIQTRDEQIISNSLFQEAQAICKFLMEAKTKDVTLVGYSQ